MKYAMIYVLLVVVCLTCVLRTVNTNSMENLMTSVGPSIFELSCNIEDKDVDDVDMINLDQEKFVKLLTEEIQKNKTFYQGDIKAEFYFYNVKTKGTCGGGVSCNGVQIKMTFEAFYMTDKIQEFRYEVKMNEM